MFQVPLQPTVRQSHLIECVSTNQTGQEGMVPTSFDRHISSTPYNQPGAKHRSCDSLTYKELERKVCGNHLCEALGYNTAVAVSGNSMSVVHHWGHSNARDLNVSLSVRGVA